MEYDVFKTELLKQIHINSKYFKHKEIQAQYDLAETIAKEDFEG